MYVTSDRMDPEVVGSSGFKSPGESSVDLGLFDQPETA